MKQPFYERQEEAVKAIENLKQQILKPFEPFIKKILDCILKITESINNKC